MQFIMGDRKGAAAFLLEPHTLPGVRRIAGAVGKDVSRVTGMLPVITEDISETGEYVVLVLTMGIGQLIMRECFRETREMLSGKREVYRIFLSESGQVFPEAAGKKLLIVAGSDKRGTIYGLFRLSEKMGVSPWVDWADVPVKRRESVVFSADLEMLSKEPSVRYRGFFINDEWPSFGNWTMERNGGFNAVCYERVFELLLRLKGNYLWPAMWSASFPLDGPGLLNEELADELGIVISFSHHEPCMRASEEWDKVRGPESIYGNEWNFYTNREGLLSYWRDGLKRSGHFDNIITIGMRGERDTSMLGPDATLAENIELLRDIIREQRKLIREEVNPDADRVPQMLALYKEVEAYFYGNEETPGLMGAPELEQVTLLLCEDNYGNMRTLPTPEMRNHPGGYGMYYHFDYHGGPISYEWVNSTPLTKVWEQMTMAYEYGVRDIWVVNVGDLKPQELPLSFFLDLAYDYEAYGIGHPNETTAYTREFVRKNFGEFIRPEYDREQVLRDIADVLSGYTWANNVRRPEALSRTVYHPVHGRETGRMLALAEELTELAEKSEKAVSEPAAAAFLELVYYPAVASMNVLKMQLYAGLNGMCLAEGNPLADRYAMLTADCIAKDRMLTDRYHSAAGSKWIHMMSSKHVGFVNWNDEGSDYPAVYTLKAWEELAEKPEGILFPSEEPFTEELLKAPAPEFRGRTREEVSEEEKTHPVTVKGAVIPAVQYRESVPAEGCSWTLLSGYGRSCDSLKVLPVGRHFPDGNGPAVTYTLTVEQAGKYTLYTHFAPSNPAKLGAPMRFGIRVNDGELTVIDSIPEDYRAGDCFNWRWSKHVLENERVVKSPLLLPEGTVTLSVVSIDPELVLQRLDISAEQVLRKTEKAR